ncbi:hypothetical protein AB0M43_16810 [Longispora sp. NPDC051575]|uniref:hypothetical protein n=1 Tax=Longispora sp. NPDC051575 TaxID=3154943 RepID=UPI003444F223
MSTSPDGLGRTPAELPEFHLPGAGPASGPAGTAATSGPAWSAPDLDPDELHDGYGPEDEDAAPDRARLRTTVVLAALGVALVTAASLLPNLTVELDGKAMAAGTGAGLGSLVSMLSRSALADGFVFGLGVFALIALAVTAATSTGRLNGAARLAAAGVTVYVLGSMLNVYLSLQRQLDPTVLGDFDRPNRSADFPTPELVAQPGAFCAILGILLLAAAVVAAGPRPAFLHRFGQRTAEPVEPDEEGRDIQVSVH